MDIVFWQGSLSMHLHPVVESVAQQLQEDGLGKVSVVAVVGMKEQRRRQGWSLPVYKFATVTRLDQIAEPKAFVDRTVKSNKIHIFYGFHCDFILWAALNKTVKLDHSVYVLSERPNTLGLGSYWKKRIVYSIHGLRFNRKIKGVFGYGSLGVSFFRLCFFSAHKVHESAYGMRDPVEVSETKDSYKRNSENPYQFTFIGSDLKRKRLDLLLRALGTLNSAHAWNLIVVSADDLSAYKLIGEEEQINDHIQWCDAMANQEVREVLSKTGTLVLPSDHDGWGAVVNEALQEGARTIVSDACGAASVVSDSTFSHLFEVGNVTDLADKLTLHIAMGAPDVEARINIRKWAKENISSYSIAKRMLQVLNADARHQ